MKDSQSFRRKDRKVIAESKSQRDANRASQSQEELLGGIQDKLDKLDDVQASTELTSDTVENKGNEILKGLGDVVAATELTAEAVEKGTGEFKKLNDIASQISDKLSKLTSVLEEKLTPQTQQTGASNAASSSTALAVISDAIPDIQTDQEKITEALDNLLPRLEDNRPDADFTDEPEPAPAPVVQPPAQVPAPKEDEEEKKKGKSLADKIGALLKVTKDGFKQSIGFSDKIAGMLFKYTITAAIEAAKMAAMLLSLVLAIDVIRINFNYWAELLKANFTEFSERLGKWAPLFKDIIDAVNEVKSAWEKGDWSGLTIAIVKGVGKAIMNLTELIVLGISKLMASVLRLIPGQEDRADALEADSLKTYQKHTGAKLTDEESNLVATQDVKKMNEDKSYEADNPRLTNAADKIKLANGQMTLDEYKKRQSDRDSGNTDPFFNMSKENQIKTIKARNEAQASIDRTSDYLDSNDGSDKFKNSAKGAIDNINSQLNSGDLDGAPKIKADIQGQLDALNKKYDALANKPAVKAESPKESEEVKTVDRINSRTNSQGQAQPQGANITQVNNNVKKSTNQFTLPTQTATVAPGLFGHTSQVN